jgi:redox-sensing transcriptional repressor
MPSERTIGRLSIYRRLLQSMKTEGVTNAFSHELSARAGATAAQVRRDLMVVGYEGSPQRGYETASLLAAIDRFLDPPEPQSVALVGVGNLGRAILAFFHGRRPKLRIVAAFDTDPELVGRMIQGCPVYPVSELAAVVQKEQVEVGVITVPAREAQSVAEELVRAGIRGVVNFAPAPVRVPESIVIEEIDMTTTLEKVAYFARRRGGAE